MISDIRLPGVSGMTVLEGMYRLANFPPMLLITAFGDETIHAAVRRIPGAEIMDKPVRMEALVEKTRATASGRAARGK